MNRASTPRLHPFGRALFAIVPMAVSLACGTTPRHYIVPVPVDVQRFGGDSLTVATDATIGVVAGGDDALAVAEHLAAIVGTTPESRPGIEQGAAAEGAVFRLSIDSGEAARLGPEGYRLTVDVTGARIEAAEPAGLFYGVQTLRQLLPERLEYGASRPSALRLPHVRIEDRPRFAWRGAMLDVSRHFFDVPEVKRYIDLMATHKLNRLHLHLSDDQGWRIEVPGYPALTEVGGTTEVGGGKGGFYTTDDFHEIVRYAADRFITVIPEIDLPGHTNAALASVPELNCDGEARSLYTGIAVGFSTVCVDREETWRFVDAVVAHLAEVTPGPWIHLGGDEVQELTDAEYRAFIERAESIVRRYGKSMIGWQEIAAAELDESSVVQFWNGTGDDMAALNPPGAVILSPASRVYLDIKYDAETPIGLDWAGLTSVRHAYDWDPVALVPGFPAERIAGVEAPLWTETLDTIEDLEFMAFPRLAAVAELAWSSPESRDWDDFRRRIARLGLRWSALGVNFYRSPEIDWVVW